MTLQNFSMKFLFVKTEAFFVCLFVFWYLMNTKHTTTLLISPSLKTSSLTKTLTTQGLSLSSLVCSPWIDYVKMNQNCRQAMGRPAILHFLSSFWNDDHTFLISPFYTRAFLIVFIHPTVDFQHHNHVAIFFNIFSIVSVVCFTPVWLAYVV